MPLPSGFADDAAQIVGSAHVKRDAETCDRYGTDSLKQGRPADLVVLPGSTSEVSAVAGLCDRSRVPLVVRGGGTGYTGGAVPTEGGVVLSLERMNRILEIDEANLLAVVEPHVVTGDLQDAVERVGLFYPPDPASLRESVIGGNVAEGAGGPRAFKYGTTRHYVLGLEAVLPGGEIIRTGSKAVKNVVGYDLTRLIVGSEGTLAIVTQVVVRLIPKPPAQATLRVTFDGVKDAVGAVGAILQARVVPATIEIVDRDCLDAVARYLGESLAPDGTGAMLLIEVDGFAESVSAEARLVEETCRASGATEVLRAQSAGERESLWRVRRELSPALKTISTVKLNNDIVVPKGRLPQLFDLVEQLKREKRLRIPCFGHAGDGNIHVNIMVEPGDADLLARARSAVPLLFKGVVALEGSISGEHGIGFAKAPYIGIELGPAELSLMRRVKHAFDPHGILNPGKIFPPDEAPGSRVP